MSLELMVFLVPLVIGAVFSLMAVIADALDERGK